MATNEVTIKVLLRNLAGKQIDALNKGLKTVGSAAKNLGTVFTGLKAQLIGVFGTAAIAAFTKNAIDVFAKFDDTMKAVGAVTNATAEEMKLLTATAKEMGSTTRFSAAEAADGLRFLGMAGFEAQEAVKALPGVLNLASAGALDLGQASDIATNILSGFNLEIEQLNSVNDVMVKTFTSSNSSLSELGEAFKYVGPVAAGVGADFEDLVGSLGKLHDAGIKGSMAGTTLRSALSALLNPTDAEAKLMAQLEERMGGVKLQIQDASGRFVGFRKIVEQLEKAGLKGEEALALFGDRAGPGMQALLQVGSKALEDYIKGLKNANGISKRVADEMESGIGGAIREARSAFEGFKIALIDSIDDELAAGIKRLANFFRGLTSQIQNLADEGKIQEWAKLAVDSFQLVMTWGKKVAQVIEYLSKTVASVMLLISGEYKAAGEALQDSFDSLDKVLGINQKETIFHKIPKDIEYVRILKSEIAGLAKAEEELLGKRSEPIGRGKAEGATASKVSTSQRGLDVIAQSKADLIKLQAVVEKEFAVLDIQYDKGLITLEDYFERRKELMKEVAQEEIAILQRTAESISDPSKRAIADAKVMAAKQRLSLELLELEAEQEKGKDKLRKEELKKIEEHEQNKLAIKQIFANVNERINAAGGEGGMEAIFQKELADLQERQQKELEFVRKHEKDKTEVARLEALHRQEQEKLEADQSQRLLDFKLSAAKQTVNGMSKLFGEMYEATDKQNKELFYLSKAAAIAEATISIAQGMAKAWGSGGIAGFAGAALVAAQGAILISKIVSTGFAAGGEIPGSSPTSKADNIPIMATAGEFMHPVDSVKYYGKDVMEAIRLKRIPREVFSGWGMPTEHRKTRRTRYAEGGSIANVPSTSSSSEKQNITIMNYIDRDEMLSALASPEGNQAVINVISRRKEQITRILR
jgi:TP901 family phage tail tape measure protein